MIGCQKITHEKVWEYLNRISSYLTLEEIETFDNLFQLMGKDYTPIQKFGSSKLEFVLRKDIYPYSSTIMPCYFTPNSGDDTISKMLKSFDDAKSHMKINELFLIFSILPMIEENQMTIRLVEESEQFVLKLNIKN